METSKKLLNLPNEILMKILSKSKNNNLLLVCKRFYELETKLNKDNIKLFINPFHIVCNQFCFHLNICNNNFLTIFLG